MKGILIEPGRAPEPANLPDTLSAMEARLGGTVEHYIFPRTPAVLFFRTAGQPVNRVVRGQPLCGTIFCYGWRGGDIKPLSGALLAELHTRDLEIKGLYDKRTFTGQLAAQKKHFAEEMISYPEAPDEPVSASELIRQQQDILARNGENQRKRTQLAQLSDLLERQKQVVADLEFQLTGEKQRLVTMQADVKIAQTAAEDLQDESTAELEASIRDVEETNRKVRANLEKARAKDEAAQYASEYDRLTESIQQKRADRMALLNGADLPLPGLSVEDGVLTYKGKHWRDMSGSDQLRVAAAIVRRLNPDCGFVLLDKLEQMDMTTLQEFSAWLEAEGLQAIATRVSTGSECQIIIEDGMVKDAEPPVTEKPQPRSWTKGAF